MNEPSSDNPEEVILAIRNLKTVFNGAVIHENLNLRVRAGETLVILGESGSGKTTLLRILVGLERPTSGVCLFAGRDLFTLSAKDWAQVRTQIAYAFQGGALFDSLTIQENLEFPLREHTAMSAKERLQRVVSQLDDLGLGRIEGLRPAELSGGMQKRVGVARAIILDPPVILYDEPTAGLDPTNVERVNDIILRLKKRGKTSIVVTHDAGCALAVADRFAFLDGGCVALEQSRAEFEGAPHPRLREYFIGAQHHAALVSTRGGSPAAGKPSERSIYESR